jgi:hypothetical protein
MNLISGRKRLRSDAYYGVLADSFCRFYTNYIPPIVSRYLSEEMLLLTGTAPGTGADHAGHCSYQAVCRRRRGARPFPPGDRRPVPGG